ncbi:NAD-P-binding protein [Stereum hirsutum FP-91666 SS1]|uniref:NAD-P-binding protein n=1 Tax=Stereum hirsutum (strain FP-91666) TaxID=721885 RepID=UPI000444A302|nr:NAD-P-binding protein [Stereum hirsutum FP-91666 SS1]EIM82355.1 NAD-P-binding protein [Stereum hirsutum FP-91666 SS1]
MSPENHPFNTAYTLPHVGAGLASVTKRTSPITSPKAHEILVKIHAASLNYRDFAMISAFYPISPPDNVVLGSDMAGEVVEVGEGVSAEEFKVGDRVTANFNQVHLFGTEYGPNLTAHVLGQEVDGVLQEYRVFKADALLHIPKHLSYEEAACYPCAGVTAWNALYGGTPLKPGQTVLFQGTGGVSMAGLVFAVRAGAKTIITSGSDEKLTIAKKLGATHTINYKTHPHWDKVVLELTNGVGAHHIFDNVGVEEIEKCFNCAAYSGNIQCIGFLGDQTKPGPNVLMHALLKNLTIRGVYVGSQQLHMEMLQFVETNGLRPHIDRVFAFEDAMKALEYLGLGRHIGKVVVKVST